MASSRRIIGAFPIGDFGEFAIAEWHPDPAVLEQEILQMADDFEDWEEPLIEAQQVMIEDTKRHFVEEREPIGAKWVPLDEQYAAEKAREFPNSKILSRTGALEEAATSEDAWLVTEDAIFFNAGVLPTSEHGVSYGEVHQEGSSRAVTTFHRIMRNIEVSGKGSVTLFGKPLTPEQSAFVAKHGQPEGRGRNLPARPFIGASIQAIEAIQAIFLKHMHDTIEIPWEEPTIVEAIGPEMGTNVLGSFPIISHTGRGQPIIRTPRGPRFGRKP